MSLVLRSLIPGYALMDINQLFKDYFNNLNFRIRRYIIISKQLKYLDKITIRYITFFLQAVYCIFIDLIKDKISIDKSNYLPLNSDRSTRVCSRKLFLSTYTIVTLAKVSYYIMSTISLRFCR